MSPPFLLRFGTYVPSAYIVTNCTYFHNGTFGQSSSQIVLFLISICPSNLQTFAQSSHSLRLSNLYESTCPAVIRHFHLIFCATKSEIFKQNISLHKLRTILSSILNCCAQLLLTQDMGFPLFRFGINGYPGGEKGNYRSVFLISSGSIGDRSAGGTSKRVLQP